MSILGTRVVRKEDPKFLTTGGTYVDDVHDPRLDVLRDAVRRSRCVRVSLDEPMPDRGS